MSSPSQSSGTEVADIFRRFGPRYRQHHKLPCRHLKAMSAIEQCRTAALGGHIDECDQCGHRRISYNSCRDRHCPKCQNLAKERWLKDRQKDLLPVPYFHIVFTIPDLLNALTLVNQKVVYDILFRAASRALLQLGKDPRYLGADIGLIASLHTWGQNLMDHPHLHCVVPGGGLSKDGKKWVSSREDFFVPVKVLSRLFRGKFLHYLKKAYDEGKLKCVGKVGFLADEGEFKRLLDTLYGKEWNVYAKEPFGGPKDVLDYVGRYTHRVAISNNRIVRVENGQVTFRWRDYRDGDTVKLMTLDVFEFIRRFLLHILPTGFFKIRYYGILSSRNRQTKLKRCKEIFGIIDDQKGQATHSATWEELLFELTGTDLRICPCCKKGRMIRKEVLRPVSHSPP